MDLPLPASHTDPAPAGGWVPVDRCTLPTAAQPLRGAAFDELFAASLTAVERPSGVATQARLLLAGGADLRDRVQRLADAETACCSFFAFTVTSLSDHEEARVALDIEVPPASADVLAALVARAERALGTPA